MATQARIIDDEDRIIAAIHLLRGIRDALAYEIRTGCEEGGTPPK